MWHVVVPLVGVGLELGYFRAAISFSADCMKVLVRGVLLSLCLAVSVCVLHLLMLTWLFRQVIEGVQVTDASSKVRKVRKHHANMQFSQQIYACTNAWAAQLDRCELLALYPDHAKSD
jgi:hypothetical protein